MKKSQYVFVDADLIWYYGLNYVFQDKKVNAIQSLKLIKQFSKQTHSHLMLINGLQGLPFGGFKAGYGYLEFANPIMQLIKKVKLKFDDVINPSKTKYVYVIPEFSKEVAGWVEEHNIKNYVIFPNGYLMHRLSEYMPMRVIMPDAGGITKNDIEKAKIILEQN